MGYLDLIHMPKNGTLFSMNDFVCNTFIISVDLKTKLTSFEVRVFQSTLLTLESYKEPFSTSNT